MAVDPKKWTLKTQEAFAAAIDQAQSLSNPELTPDHLLGAMMRQEGTIVPAVLAKLGQAPLMVRNRADEAVQKLPKAYGGAEPRMNKELNNVVENADSYRKDLRDDFLSVEHLLLAMNARLDVGSEELLQVLKDVRGSHRVTDQNPEEKFASAREVRPGPHRPRRRRQDRPGHRTRRGDPPRASRCCRGGPRTTRCSSANRASARRRSSRASRCASSDGDVPERLEEQAGHRARHRPRCSPAPSTAASSRSASRRCSRRSTDADGQVITVHRRAAHHRRRRRRRRRDGRRQHDQADARPRRAADDRRDDARRVPQVRREGPGPRAPLPAGVRRRAVGRGHDRHPARPEGALRGAPRRAHPGLGARQRSRPVGPVHHRAASCPTRRSTSSTRRRRSCGSRSTRCRPRSTSSSGASSSSRSSRSRSRRRPTLRRPSASRHCTTSWPRSMPTPPRCVNTGSRRSRRSMRSAPEGGAARACARRSRRETDLAVAAEVRYGRIPELERRHRRSHRPPRRTPDRQAHAQGGGRRRGHRRGRQPSGPVSRSTG